MSNPSKAEATYKLSSIHSTSLLDLIGKMLSVYSAYFITSGKGTKPLRPQLIKILSVYVLHGYNKDAKRLATELCDFKDDMRIDGLNKELRDAGYIVKDPYNDRVNHLNPDLRPLGESLYPLHKKMHEFKAKGLKSIKISLDFEVELP